jgi:hypothetical protein
MVHAVAMPHGFLHEIEVYSVMVRRFPEEYPGIVENLPEAEGASYVSKKNYLPGTITWAREFLKSTGKNREIARTPDDRCP